MTYDRDELLAFLETVPFSQLAEAYNRRVAKRRKSHSTGRPKVLRTCQCGFTGGFREMRAHKCKNVFDFVKAQEKQG